ncbi:MAG TPA: hypothetical protein VH309_04485 [Elusimicrobiota bacterium]|jgi:hypothetical protein|nr:hypothetical protein [Elusimicrobiota bacterium]
MIVQTVVATGHRVPTVSLTPQRALRFSVAFTLAGAAMHYLVSGRKEADIGKMITGAVLALASMLFL